MRFDLVDLQVFLHACDSGSMTAAARSSHLTLAAVSARLRRLEELAGVALLLRHARGVEPTPAGEALASHARKVMQEVGRLRQSLHDAPREPELVLLANTSSLARPLAGLARLLALETDRARLTVRESTSEATVQSLQWKLADVGIVSDAIDLADLHYAVLAADPLVVVTARDHPLAGAGTVRFRDALAHDWVAWGEETALGMHLANQAQRLDASIRRVATCPGHLHLLAFVAEGLGLTALPRGLLPADTAGAGLSVLTLAEPWAQRQLLVCMNPQRAGPLATRLYAAVQAIWAQPEAPRAGAASVQRR